MTTKTTTKPTSTMQTTASSNPFAGLSQEQLDKALGVFRDEQSWFTKTDIPYMIALNNKGRDYGFFIFESDLPKVGWYGLEHNGIYNDKIKFGLENEVKPGFVFTAPTLVIADASPRSVEVNKEGAKAYATAFENYNAGKDYDPYHLALAPKANVIVEHYCNYDGSRIDPVTGRQYNGAELYYATKEPVKLTELRTMYLVFLANEEGELLHSEPFTLSVKGLVAVSIGEKLEAFSKNVMAHAASYGEEFKKLMQARMSLFALRNFYLTVTTNGDMGGAGQKQAWITGVTNIEGRAITDETILQKMADVAEVNDGYAWKTATQISQLQPQLEGVTLNALPASTSLEGIDVKSEALPF